MNAGDEDFLSALLSRLSGMAIFEGCRLVALETQCGDGDTPLHVIAYEGDVDTLNRVASFIKEVDIHGDIGNTPLHTAIIHKKVDMARRLIELGADVNEKNDYGDTPLELLACFSEFSGLHEWVVSSDSFESTTRNVDK